jgi:actin-related protein
MFQDLTSLVLDIGSYQSRVGYGGDEAPKIVAPSFVGYTATLDKEKGAMVGKKYLCMDRTNFEIERIFRYRG